MENKLLTTAEYILFLDSLNPSELIERTGLINQKDKILTDTSFFAHVKYQGIVEITKYLNQTAPRPEMFVEIPEKESKIIFPGFKIQEQFSDPLSQWVFIIKNNEYELSFTPACFFKDIATGEVTKLNTLEDLARVTGGELIIIGV